MKKSFFLLMIFCSVQTFGQVAIQDAWALKKILGATPRRITASDNVIALPEVDDVLAIVKSYVPGPDSNNRSKVEEDFKNNPFMAFEAVSLSNDLAGATRKASFFKSSLSALGDLDVTNIANGIAQFMIERARQELTVAFFNRFKEFAEKNPEFGILFPQTTDNLENLLAFKYPEMLPALRVGFFEDLKAIGDHLDEVLELPRYEKLLKNFPEVRVAIRSIRIVQELESTGANPADLFTEFAQFPEWSDTTISSKGFINFGSSVRLTNIFSNSLRSSDNHTWVKLKDLKKLFLDEDAFRIYLGLIYQKSQTEKIAWYVGKNNDLKSFCSIMADQKNNLFVFENKVTKFVELGEKVDRQLDSLNYKRDHHTDLTKDDYYTYINTSIDIIEYGFSIAQIFNKDLDISGYTVIARKATDLYRHIYREEYTQALTNAVDILNGVYDLLAGEKGRIDDMSGTLTPAMTAKKDALHDSKGYGKLAGIISKITKYGVFMANMVEAKTPDEVASVMENAVLPVGSSSIKKSACFNMAVQSYLGAYARLRPLKHNTNTAWSDKFGVSAPIGISLSWGLGKKGQGGALTFFAPLFDLGAIVDYRLKNDSTATGSGGTEPTVEKDYKIRLGQIVSPGAYVVYGLPVGIPLSIGFGGQYGPGLARIDATGPTVNNPQWRWSMIIGVDIPFFNLKNTSKPYRPN